jgi:protein JSN1
MAAVITLNSVRLATNANGALLLTWLLDTCNFPKRFKTLAPRLLTHLAKLCTHKLASLTVLKLINQRSEPEAREIILTALFSNPDDPENRILKRILEDQVHGAAVIYKILTSPFVVDATYQEKRAQMVVVVRMMLQKLKVQPTQGYKRLMDEVGLSERTIATPPLNGHRGPPRSTTPRDYGAPPPPQTYAPGTFYSPQFRGTPQQYMPQTTGQMDLTSRPGQIDPSLLGMELNPSASGGPGTVYSPSQMGTAHQHPDPQTAAYQYQQMLLMQSRPPYNGYSSTPPPQQPQPVPQTVYPTSQQSQFGGLLMPATTNLAPGMYNVNGNQYPYPQGDMYAANRQRPR